MSPPATGGDAARTFLRQMARGLATYLLFPGDLEQAAFVAAVDRIRAAAGEALRHGPVIVEIRRGVFRAEGEPVEGGEQLDRLARACFDRRVELLSLRAVPSARELAAVFDVLSLPEEEVEAAGGVGALLRSRGVHAVGAGEVEPATPGEEQGLPLDTLDPTQLAVWRTLTDTDGLVDEVVAVADGTGSVDAAEALFHRFRAMARKLPDAVRRRPEFIRAVHRVVTGLPAPLRRDFVTLALTGLERDPLAGRYVGSLADTELAGLLAELGEGGALNPVALAHRVVRLAGRRPEVVALTRALMEPGGRQTTIAAGEGQVALLGAGEDSESRQAVADLLAGHLTRAGRDDAEAIRRRFPAEPGSLRELALAAFEDYLLVEEDTGQLDRALTVWDTAVGDCLDRGDRETAERLLRAAETLGEGGAAGGHAVALVRAHRGRALTAGRIRLLVVGAGEPRQRDWVRELLAGMGRSGVDGLLEALAQEEDAGIRAQLVTLTVELAGPHLDAVHGFLDHRRWYVVRNALTILWRIGSPDSFRAVTAAAAHPHRAVRREACRALVACGGAEAVPHLEALGTDGDGSVRRAAVLALEGIGGGAALPALVALAGSRSLSREERGRVLEAVARTPGQEADAALRGLGRWWGRPRLPWSLRRRARAHRRERAGGRQP